VHCPQETHVAIMGKQRMYVILIKSDMYTGCDKIKHPQSLLLFCQQPRPLGILTPNFTHLLPVYKLLSKIWQAAFDTPLLLQGNIMISKT